MLSTMLETKSRSFRPRRSVGDRLRGALLELASEEATLLGHTEKAWASVTFSGTRHEMVLEFDGEQGAVAGELFVATLPDHEFAIAGQLVADAVISQVNHSVFPQPRMEVHCTVLLLVDA